MIFNVSRRRVVGARTVSNYRRISSAAGDVHLTSGGGMSCCAFYAMVLPYLKWFRGRYGRVATGTYESFLEDLYVSGDIKGT